MLRWVVVVLGVGVLWLGYDSWFASDARADATGGAGAIDGLEGEVGAGAGPTGATPSESGGAPPAPAALAGSGQAGTDPVLDQLIGGLKSGEAKAVDRGFAVLRRLQGARRERLARVLVDVSTVAGPAERVALLGRNNAFLHCPEGRELAREAIASATEQKPEIAVVTFTRLIERCMRGPIENSHVEARRVVDEAWKAMQRPLRRTVLNPENVARARTHRVQPGESLDRIARRFQKDDIQVEAWTIATFNRISDPRRLQAGQVVKVPVDPIRTVLEKNSYLMAMYVGEVIFRLYRVGHGRDDRTPETTFTIGAKQEHPDWYAPGRVIPYGHPDNMLGDYFVKFRHDSFSGFGVHGTAEPETIGTRSSAGCIRMADADIEEYFRIAPRETEVVIRASR